MPAQYYRGEAKLPATDMRPWFMDLPSQLKVAFEKPRDPIGIYNHEQQEKRALCAFAFALVLGAGGWFWRQETTLLLGVIAGFALGELAGSLIFKSRPYPARHLARLSDANGLLGEFRCWCTPSP